MTDSVSPLTTTNHDDKFAHYFDVCISKRIESDIEDFDDALNTWINSYESIDTLRNALLTTDQSTKDLLKGILHSDTWLIKHD